MFFYHNKKEDVDWSSWIGFLRNDSAKMIPQNRIRPASIAFCTIMKIQVLKMSIAHTVQLKWYFPGELSGL